MADVEEKPTLEEVINYARKQIPLYLNKKAASLPDEQREEVEQEAYLRICKAYVNLDASRGWKSFVQNHCKGAVLDYLRLGNGFEEAGLTGSEPPSTKTPWKLKARVVRTDRESGDTLDVEEVAALEGLFRNDERGDLEPKWDLVARMARYDEDIHVVAKLLLGFKQRELSVMFAVTRERISQRLQEFSERLHAPEHLHSRWVQQTIFAFGLCERFGMEELDLGVGYEFDPVDLHSEDPFYIRNNIGQVEAASLLAGDGTVNEAVALRAQMAPREKAETEDVDPANQMTFKL